MPHSPIPVLDDIGFVRLVEPWGVGDAGVAEAGIIEAARQSTQGNFKGWGPIHEEGCPQRFEGDKCPECTTKAGDERLLRYLYTHQHDSPFEFAGMVIEVKAPIMVFREWHRHRTQSYNEMSGRYTELPDAFYVPSLERLQKGGQDWVNKQSSGAGIHPRAAAHLQRRMDAIYKEARAEYERLLADGLSREIARMVLPVSQYSQMRASANLRNWLAFLTLRQAPEAQYEIRQYANAVASIIQEQFPRTYALFCEGQSCTTS